MPREIVRCVNIGGGSIHNGGRGIKYSQADESLEKFEQVFLILLF